MIRLTNPVTVLIVVGVAGSAFAGAKLTAPETDFAYGFVPQNAKITHRYVLKSTGTDTLRVDRIQPGCGCTQAPLPKTALAPGDSTLGELIFNTGAYNGPVTKVATVYTIPPDSVQTILHFTANVVSRPDSTSPVIISPYKLNLTLGSVKARAEQTFTIHNVSAQDLIPRLVDAPGDLMHVRLPEVIPAGKTAEAVLSLTPTGTSTDFEKSITIEFSDTKTSRFTVPIKHAAAGVQSANVPTGH